MYVVLNLVRTGVCVHTPICIPLSYYCTSYNNNRDLNLDLHPTSARVPSTMVVVETMVETSPRGLAQARSTPE